MQFGCRGRLANRHPFKGDQARYRPNLLIQWVGCDQADVCQVPDLSDVLNSF